MNKDQITEMARKAGFESNSLGMTYTSGRLPELLERFADLIRADERNKLAAWMIAQGYATGHGDTIDGLLEELRWQVRESEREACAKVCEEVLEQYRGTDMGKHAELVGDECAAAIRARDQR
jgi:hypothetical protein